MAQQCIVNGFLCENIDDTKGVIKNRKSKYRQYKDRQEEDIKTGEISWSGRVLGNGKDDFTL